MTNQPDSPRPKPIACLPLWSHEKYADNLRSKKGHLADMKTNFRFRSGRAPASSSGAVIVKSSTLRPCNVRHKASRRRKGRCCLSRLALRVAKDHIVRVRERWTRRTRNRGNTSRSEPLMRASLK